MTVMCRFQQCVDISSVQMLVSKDLLFSPPLPATSPTPLYSTTLGLTLREGSPWRKIAAAPVEPAQQQHLLDRLPSAASRTLPLCAQSHPASWSYPRSAWTRGLGVGVFEVHCIVEKLFFTHKLPLPAPVTAFSSTAPAQVKTGQQEELSLGREEAQLLPALPRPTHCHCGWRYSRVGSKGYFSSRPRQQRCVMRCQCCSPCCCPSGSPFSLLHQKKLKLKNENGT
jgi:hypothetical protein